MPWSVLFYIGIIALSIFMIVRGFQLGNTHQNKVNEIWNDIRRCKACGSTNFHTLHARQSKYVGGGNIGYKVQPGQGNQVSSDDLREPSGEIITNYYLLTCSRCQNIMLSKSLSHGFESPSEQQFNYDQLKSTLQFKEIGPAQTEDLLKKDLLAVHYSDENGGCAKTTLLVLGWTLLIIAVGTFIWAFS
jgi:hypothetical protein